MKPNSNCPAYDAKAIPYLHTIAALLDALSPAQCQQCGNCSIVPPPSLSLLGRPDIVIAPIPLMVWCVTQDVRLSAQWGVLGAVVEFGLVAKFAGLVAFVPEDEKTLYCQRTRMLWRKFRILTGMHFVVAQPESVNDFAAF